MKKTEHQSDKTCVICGKPKMDLFRYQCHMGYKHSINLENEDLDIYEYAEAREDWENMIATANYEEKQKLSCDYDSEAGKC